MSDPLDRPPAREAGPELLVLAEWEEFAGWLLCHTARWPKWARFPLAQQVQKRALKVGDLLVIARYAPKKRVAVLERVNLLLERMRLLFRLARSGAVMPKAGFESAMRGLDTTGRMLHGWRKRLDPGTGRTRGGPPE